LALTIALDGPASSGKGTVARGVARALDYQYVDTGAMYRSIALMAQRAGIDWNDASSLADLAAGLGFEFQWNGDVLRILVNGEDVTSAIRSGEIGAGASAVSRHPDVRQALLARQRALGEAGGVVMDGRDIGTVVLPSADLKVYLDAAPDVRARRRHEELLRRGETVSFESVLADLKARDHRDMTRDVAPLAIADDAVVVDTSDLGIHQAIQAVLELAFRVSGSTSAPAGPSDQ